MFDDSRAERQRRVARLRAVQQEIANQQQENALAEARAKKNRAAERDVALAQELFEQQQRDLRNEKMLQLVRDYPELRDLEQQLRTAYVAKGRTAQMQEKKLREAEEVQEEKDFLNQLVEQAKIDAERENLKKASRSDDVRKQQLAQQEQLAWKARLAAEEEEVRRRERAEVDAIVAQVQERDFLETMSRVDKQRQIQQQHTQFVEIRDARLRAEKERQEAEDRAILAYMAEQNKRKESDEKLKQEKEAIKARILEAQSRKIAAEKIKKEELETLINEFYEEQRAAKIRDEERAERDRRDRDRQMMIAANQQQMAFKAQRREQEQAEEQEFRRKMMEQFAANDRIEEMSRQKRAQAKVEHARKVQELLDEKRRQREEDLMAEALLQERQKQRDDEIKRLIAQERARLIAEHAPQLGEFMPKGL
jgi:hypothetical protein